MKAVLKYKLRNGPANDPAGKRITVSSLTKVGLRLQALALPEVYNAPDSDEEDEGSCTDPCNVVVVEWGDERVTLETCNALLARINSAEPDWSAAWLASFCGVYTI